MGYCLVGLRYVLSDYGSTYPDSFNYLLPVFLVAPLRRRERVSILLWAAASIDGGMASQGAGVCGVIILGCLLLKSPRFGEGLKVFFWGNYPAIFVQFWFCSPRKVVDQHSVLFGVTEVMILDNRGFKLTA